MNLRRKGFPPLDNFARRIAYSDVNWALIPKFIRVQLPFEQITKYVTQRDVAFLNSGGDIRRHPKNQIDATGQLTGPAGHADGRHAYFSGGFNRLDDISGIAAGADAPGNVTLSAESLYLFGKNIIKLIIVANAGKGIGRAAAVAENEYFVAPG